MRRGIFSLVCIAAFAAVVPAAASAAAQRDGGDKFVKFEVAEFDVPPAHGPKFEHYTVHCPPGYSAVMGSLREIAPSIFIGSSLASGPKGRDWTFELSNTSNATVKVKVQVRCLDDVLFKQPSAQVAVQPDKTAEVHATCPNGYRAVGRGEHVSMPGPPDDDDFEVFFSVYLNILGIDEAEVGIFDVFDAFDYYLYVSCIKPAPDDDKASGAKPKLKTKTVTNSVDVPAFNFGQVELKCPRGYSPTMPSFGPLPDRVNGFIDIPGTKRSQPARFLNKSPDAAHVEAKLLCIALV